MSKPTLSTSSSPSVSTELESAPTKGLAEPPPENPGFDDFFNRELSLLQFNYRVLQLAQDPGIPLLERLRFLAISTTNLDEFFEIRVAGLKQHIVYEVGLSAPEDLKPMEVFDLVSQAAHQLVRKQYEVLNHEILPALEQEGIRVLKRGTWNDAQEKWIRDYFVRSVLPVLTPVGLDPAHPFPRIVNKSLNFILPLEGKDAFGRQSTIAVVQAPRVLPRLIRLPDEVADCPYDFVMLSSVIHSYVRELFPGMEIGGCYQFRVTRDSELWVDEEEVDDLLNALKGQLQRRKFAGAVRLEVADNCSREIESFLLDQFGLGGTDLYRVNGPVNLYRLSALYDLVDRPDLKYKQFVPGNNLLDTSEANLFDQIRKQDVLLHHPYQSFTPVLRLLQEAANDPRVLAIKMTLYRIGNDSPIADALIEAARAGKEVTAVVELRARFDEAQNIDLATQLQEAGAKVVYGIVGYKAHAKMLLVVRQEGSEIRRYVHLSTGNYHVGTSRAYTDAGLMTSKREIGEDVHDIFQQLTGLGRASGLRKLLQSPFTLHSEIIKLIEAEREASEQGQAARIIAKMNSLIEPRVIRALYKASQAGVQIDLIVRGICCLRPGVPGLSENIRVRSIMGRFLEHSRVFYFYAGGEERTYLASADWMPRNFFRRVESCFPIEDAAIRSRVIDEFLRAYLDDNRQTWLLQPDGSYIRLEAAEAEPFAAQSYLLEQLQDRAGRAKT